MIGESCSFDVQFYKMYGKDVQSLESGTCVSSIHALDRGIIEWIYRFEVCDFSFKDPISRFHLLFSFPGDASSLILSRCRSTPRTDVLDVPVRVPKNGITLSTV